MYNEARYPAPEPDPNKGHPAIRRRTLRDAGPLCETDHFHSTHPTVGRRAMTP